MYGLEHYSTGETVESFNYYRITAAHIETYQDAAQSCSLGLGGLYLLPNFLHVPVHVIQVHISLQNDYGMGRSILHK